MDDNQDVRTSMAVSKGATSVVDLQAILSPQGVPLALDKGDNHVIVLFPPRCCNHQASRAVPQVPPQTGLFNTSEHAIIVAGCHLQMPGGSRMDALTFRLAVGPGFTLSYGQVIALGGDFYGDPDHPVCDARTEQLAIEQFAKNFASLQASNHEVRKILGIAYHYEYVPIKKRVSKGEPPSGVYADIPWTKGTVMNDEDQDFDQATGGGGPGSPTFGRYTYLAATNLDHFGKDAMKCYWAGHVLAQQTAIAARGLSGKEQADKMMEAYAQNAFADHFLTDIFAAGHMRTPRRKLYESAWNSFTRAFAGLCAQGMHDEDNKFGLWVVNARGDRWVAYGDARYRDFANSAGREVVKRALQQSMDDVWHAFETGSVVSDFEHCPVFAYLPTLVTGQVDRDDPSNWAPLFWWDPRANNVNRRNSIDDVSDRSYCEQGSGFSNWGLSTTTAQLKRRAGPFMPEREYAQAHYPYPPVEAGPSGELGWPPQPTEVSGPRRPLSGYGGADLNSVAWRIDGATGPTGAGWDV